VLIISHRHHLETDETTVCTHAIYCKNGLRVKRSEVPAHVLAEFDKFGENKYWDYIADLDI
jgi:hypothetical protein